MPKLLQTTFTVETKLVKSNLAALGRLSGRFSKTSVIKIRVLNTAIEISRHGISKRIEANTNGEADITLPVALLKGYLTAGVRADTTFTFRNGQLLCGGSIYSSYTIKVEPPFSNMGKIIPTNLDHHALLGYWLVKSPTEIERMELTATIEQAKRTMKANIVEALEFLRQYQVRYEDLEEMIKDNIKSSVRTNVMR